MIPAWGGRDVDLVAVALAIRGQRVRVVLAGGDFLLEPGTGELHAVSLRDSGGFHGLELGEMDGELDANQSK